MLRLGLKWPALRVKGTRVTDDRLSAMGAKLVNIVKFTFVLYEQLYSMKWNNLCNPHSV